MLWTVYEFAGPVLPDGCDVSASFLTRCRGSRILLNCRCGDFGFVSRHKPAEDRFPDVSATPDAGTSRITCCRGRRVLFLSPETIFFECVSFLRGHALAPPRWRVVYNSVENLFERFRVGLESISRFEFEFRRCGIFFFLNYSNFWCVQSSITHTMWPCMCLCCGLFVPTQFHFECCGIRNDSS